MKNILSLFILVWLLSLNVFGATKERIIREDSFLGQKVLFCRDGNYTYYVRTENSVILAWPWTKEGASGCYFGKNQIYIECRYVLGAARGPGVVSTVLKIDSGTLSRLPKIPFPAPDSEGMELLKQETERSLEKVELNLPTGTPLDPIWWDFSVREGTLAAFKQSLEAPNIEDAKYYLYDEQKKEFVPKYEYVDDDSAGEFPKTPSDTPALSLGPKEKLPNRWLFVLAGTLVCIGGLFLWLKIRSCRKKG